MCEKESCNRIITNKNCDIVIEDFTFNCNYIQVFILKLNNSKDDDNPTQTIIKTNRHQPVIFNSNGDGFYTICKLTVPIDEGKPYYYKDEKFYHNIQEVSLQEILDVNPNVSEVKVEYMYYFSTCNLKKCFINICQDIFKQQTSMCNKPNSDSSLTYKRDLLWSAMNVIKYLVEMDQLEEAQRLLEEITACNGLCSSPQPEFTSNCGCGCRK